MNRIATVTICSALALVLGLSVFVPANGPRAQAADDAKKAAGPVAVETDMHEFMEYVFQPGYKRLKAAMQSQPADKRGWKPIKAEGLSLAEACNLLFLRVPKEDADEWKTLSAQVREDGKGLYQAARKRDFAAATKHYRAMLIKCNACHDKFAGGEHQLSP